MLSPHKFLNTFFAKNPFNFTEKNCSAVNKTLSHETTYNAGYAELLDSRILAESWKKVKANNGQGGIDKVTITQYEKRLKHNLNNLLKQLQYDSYCFSPIIRFKVKTKSGKIRYLSLLTVEDKIVQSALLLVIEPAIDKALSKACFGFRKGIGIHDAVRAVNNARQRGYVYGVKADIASFFDSINREILLKKVEQIIADKKIQFLIKKAINAPIVDRKGRYLDITIGIPQGAIISPMLSNLYLNSFDRSIAKKDRRLIRYCDDFLVLTDNPQSILQITQDVKANLETIHLKLKNNKILPIDFNRGFRFLGYGFKGKAIIMKK